MYSCSLLDFLLDICRIPGGDTAVGNIFCHYRTGPYHAVVSDCDTGQNCHIAAQPHIVADCHRLRPFDTLVALLRLKRMTGRVNRHIRPDETVVADCHKAFVKYGKIEICKKILPDKNIAAEVATERLINQN